MKLESEKSSNQFNGLGLIVFLVVVLLASPMIYFLIQMMLGNEHVFLKEGVHY
ncbi:hypothetical protein [Paenibacillus sp. J2TS4]|uniref:hypothetical protein n=1 Tax=Paenibacillus sp. J2TS4 TaxID=2807194 RepID=UPI001B11DB2A|nr:hypothetical protein [Paenibacillus sp. J2TS4]GIP35273.1 hypothetical protein J2TS4_44830 [Paenibacillus sp. J2TS4]